MGTDLKAIRNRVRSVQSTKKITRAMELIAAARIVKAEIKVRESKPYATSMSRVIGNLAAAAGGNVQHPLLERRESVEHSAVLVLCSDRGLCGPYNSAVMKLAYERLLALPGKKKSVIAVGRKADQYFRYRRIPRIRVFEGVSDRPTYADAKEVADLAVGLYLDGELDHIEMVYTQFESQFRQTLHEATLLPIDTASLAGDSVEDDAGDGSAADTDFEPDPVTILSELIPKGVQSRVYSAMLEAAASEHAARRRAMKSATDNAGELIEQLTLEANKARQAAITTEILEVVSGAEALSND